MTIRFYSIFLAAKYLFAFWCLFIATFAILTGDQLVGLIFLIPFGIIMYRTYAKKQKVKNELQKLVQETVKQKSRAIHSDMGVGYIGGTNNYLFFMPFKKKLQTTVINKNYITSYSLNTKGSGIHATTFFNGVGITNEIKQVMLTLNIVTPNNDHHTFEVEISDWKKLKKELDLPQFDGSMDASIPKQFI